MLTVTYVANGGSGGPYTVQVPAGSEHTVLTPAATGISRADYTFVTWNLDEAGYGTSHAPGSVITVTESITLYAQWLEIGEAGTTGPGGDLQRETHPPFIFGFPDGSVRPDNNITRAQAAAIFFRLLCPTDHANKGDPVVNEFIDIRGDEWFVQEVSYLASMGVLLGFGDGTFRPNAPITREEFVTIMTRFNHPFTRPVEIDPWFTDVHVEMWSYPYIYFGAVRGWVEGFPDGTFRPHNPILRGEAAALINRVLERGIDDAALAVVENPFNDITPAHWAYADIIEASVEHAFIRDEDGNEIWVLGVEPHQLGQNLSGLQVKGVEAKYA
jgi:uncharacterized repeat protein (TIGR02543 family)